MMSCFADNTVSKEFTWFIGFQVIFMEETDNDRTKDKAALVKLFIQTHHSVSKLFRLIKTSCKEKVKLSITFNEMLVATQTEMEINFAFKKKIKPFPTPGYQELRLISNSDGGAQF